MIIAILLFAVLVVLVAQFLPGLRVDSFFTALKVAVVYAICHWLFYFLFGWLALPFQLITFFLFTFVINTFLLWLTDKILDDFEIKDLQTTFFAAILLTIGNSVLKWLLY